MSKVSRPDGATRAKDEHLHLFRTMHKTREIDRVLDANGHCYPFNDMIPGKNDYSWLMSPPAFPSLEVESQALCEKPVSQPLSRFAGKSEDFKVGTFSNWKPKFLARFSSPDGRPNAILVGKKNNTREQSTIQKMHQISSQLNLENSRKAQVHSNNRKPTIQDSRRLRIKDVARNHDQKRLNVSPILRNSSELSDQGPSNISIGRSHSVSRMHSSAQITALTSHVPSSQADTSDNKQENGPKLPQNPEFLNPGFTNIRAGRVSCSQFANRDCKHESKQNNSKFSDILTGQSSAHIPLTNNPEMVIKYSQKSSYSSVIRDCKPRNNTNVLVTIPPQNLNLSNPNSPGSRTGRSQSVSRVHSYAANKPASFINKIEPVTQCDRVSISCVIKDGNQESDSNGVQSSATNKPGSFINKHVTQCGRVSISSGVMKDSKQNSAPNGLTTIPPSKLGRSLSASRVHSDSQISFYSRVSNMEQSNRTQVVGSKMVDKFLKARMQNLDESHPKCRQNRRKFNTSIYDCSSFSKSICKTSLNKASRIW